MFEPDVAQDKFPGGYISLRVTGQIKALLGMQRFDRMGAVEVAMLCTDTARDMNKQVESMALDQNALLHWGQTNGLMTANDVNSRFGPSGHIPGRLGKWRAAQATLGGSTFVNSFMKRCGLVG